ncbi:nuclear transport factor 2-like protein [Nocardioides pyridinolyticus]
MAAFWNSAIAPIAQFEFEIHDSFANPGGNTCANIGRIRTSFPDGSHTTTELIMVYVVNDAGLVTSMKAYWEPDRTMASFTPA